MANQETFQEQVEILHYYLQTFEPASTYKDVCQTVLEKSGPDGRMVRQDIWIEMCSQLEQKHGSDPREFFQHSAFASDTESVDSSRRFDSFTSENSFGSAEGGSAGSGSVSPDAASGQKDPFRASLLHQKLVSRDAGKILKMSADRLEIGAAKSGWLEKEGKRGIKSFSRRWFVLIHNPDVENDGDPHCFLVYYASKKDKAPRGVVSLRAGEFNVHEPKTKRSRYPHCFRLDVGNLRDSTKWILATKTTEEKQNWMEAINAVEEEHGTTAVERTLTKEKEELQQELEQVRTQAEIEKMREITIRLQRSPMARAFQTWANTIFNAKIEKKIEYAKQEAVQEAAKEIMIGQQDHMESLGATERLQSRAEAAELGVKELQTSLIETQLQLQKLEAGGKVGILSEHSDLKVKAKRKIALERAKKEDAEQQTMLEMERRKAAQVDIKIQRNVASVAVEQMKLLKATSTELEQHVSQVEMAAEQRIGALTTENTALKRQVAELSATLAEVPGANGTGPLSQYGGYVIDFPGPEPEPERVFFAADEVIHGFHQSMVITASHHMAETELEAVAAAPLRVSPVRYSHIPTYTIVVDTHSSAHSSVVHTLAYLVYGRGGRGRPVLTRSAFISSGHCFPFLDRCRHRASRRGSVQLRPRRSARRLCQWKKCSWSGTVRMEVTVLSHCVAVNILAVWLGQRQLHCLIITSCTLCIKSQVRSGAHQQRYGKPNFFRGESVII
jgi:hypothetical protein